MYIEKSRTNWTQEIRKINLEKVEDFIKDNGGYFEILDNMIDFERFVARELGCSIKKSREYISTVRGAALFRGKVNAKKSDE